MALVVSPFVAHALAQAAGYKADAVADAKASGAAATGAAAAGSGVGESSWGYLAVRRDDEATRVVGAVKQGAALADVAAVNSALPGGVRVGGVYLIAADADSAVRAWAQANAAVLSALQPAASTADADAKDAAAAAADMLFAVLPRAAADGDAAPAIAYYRYAAGQATAVPAASVSAAAAGPSGDESLAGALLFRVHFERVMYYRHSASSAVHNAAAIGVEFDRLRDALLTGRAAFHFKAADVLFASAEAARASASTCGDVQGESKAAAAAGKGKKGKGAKGVVATSRIEESAVDVALFVNASAQPGAAPEAVFEPGAARAIRVACDVLAVAGASEPVAAATDALLERLRLQLSRLQALVVAEAGPAATAAAADAKSAALTPADQPLHARALHFKPAGAPPIARYAHTLTLCFPIRPGDVEAGEPSLLPQRRALHDQLFLPQTRPTLRTVCAVQWGSSGVDEAGRLYDVHLSLGASGVSGGRVYAVDGRYAYHHYQQDKVNDKGWGCAYRTFQTLVSWFKEQHYISATPPSHVRVQQALVELKEKSAAFVGSSEWIGAIELGLVLDHLYGVTAKILPVPSGAEVAAHARALARHFESHGTPVMIGGGQLAYGLLGVHYNEQTGDCKYLILDPHYTGDDDLTAVIGKGWCAWRDDSLFLRNAFYNFCMPQRPNVI